MQDGSVTVERRKRGPDVWCFRWRERGPDGRRIHGRIVPGTADDLKSIASARRAVVGLRREINLNDVRIRTEAIAQPIYRSIFSNESSYEAIPASPIQRGELTKVISGNGSSLGGVSIGCLKFGQWKSNHG